MRSMRSVFPTDRQAERKKRKRTEIKNNEYEIENEKENNKRKRTNRKTKDAIVPAFPALNVQKRHHSMLALELPKQDSPSLDHAPWTPPDHPDRAEQA